MLLCSNVLPPSWLQTARIYCHAVPLGQESGQGYLGLPRLRSRCWPEPELQSCLGSAGGGPFLCSPGWNSVPWGCRAESFRLQASAGCWLVIALNSWRRPASPGHVRLPSMAACFSRGRAGEAGSLQQGGTAVSCSVILSVSSQAPVVTPTRFSWEEASYRSHPHSRGVGRASVPTPEGGDPGSSRVVRAVCFAALALLEELRGLQRKPPASDGDIRPLIFR